jgi:hypothetical protein
MIDENSNSCLMEKDFHIELLYGEMQIIQLHAGYLLLKLVLLTPDFLVGHQMDFY